MGDTTDTHPGFRFDAGAGKMVPIEAPGHLTQPVGPDPFADIDPSASPDQPVGPDPFADLNLQPVAPVQTSGIGAFISHAIHGALPAAGGLAAAGAGAEAGALFGAGLGALAGPAAPVVAPVGAAVGGLVGGLGGFFAGSSAVEGAQDFVLHQMPDNWQDALGQSDRIQRLQESQHPLSSFIGGMAPYAVTMMPGSLATKALNLPADATAFQRLMANPLTGRLFGGAAMGGMELGQEEWSGQTPDWAKIGISTGFGMVFNKPTRFGEYLTNLGAGAFHPTAVPPEGVLSPTEPTVAQAGDLGVLGPGITESTFRGDEEQSLTTKIAANNAAADEQTALGPLSTPDVDAIARRLSPEVFQRNDELLTQRDALRSWIDTQSNPPDEAFDDLAAKRYAAEEALRNANPRGPAARGFRAELADIATQEQDLGARRSAWESGTHVDTPDILLARQHLMDTEHALWDLGPDISAARRRAADHVEEPEQTPAEESPTVAAEVPPPEPGPEAAPQKSIEAQRAFITADRTAQLMAAGSPRDVAEQSAHVEAAYYETLARRFNGALGSAEDLYRARAARVIGPDGQVPPESTPPVTRGAAPQPIRAIADIQAQEKVSATKAKQIQDQEVLARATPTDGGTAVLERPAQTEAIDPSVRPRIRTGADIALEDGIRDPKAIIAVQNQELLALSDWQTRQRAGAASVEPARNPELDRLAATIGLPKTEAPPAAVIAAVVDRLPSERVVDEINAEAEAGQIEYREAERAAAEAAPEVTEDPDRFYDSDQSRPLEELEREHRPPSEIAATEQRLGGGREPEPAAPGAGPVPEGGEPPGPVVGTGGRGEPEGAGTGGTAVAGEPVVAPAAAVEPTGERPAVAAEPAAGGEQGPPAGAEFDRVAPLLPTPEQPNIQTHASGNGGLESLDPAEIGVDAARFQFKGGGDEAGVTDRLEGVETWDPRFAGTVLVFRDAEGRNWIADGHQRLGLAKRLVAAGQSGIRLNAFVLDARDGMTDAQARVIAAAKNITEGTGTAIDAAKVVKEAEVADLEVPPLPPRSTLARDGRALARLSADAFGMAVNDVVPTGQAAIVGRIVTDPARQVEAMRVLAKAKPGSLQEAEFIVRDVMETATEASTQGTLFGEEHYAASATLERAKVASEAMRQLGRDRTTFHTLVSEADRIQGHGENVLDTEANRNRLTTDEQARQLLTQLATRKGPVSDALTGIARRVRDGEIGAAGGAREFLGIIRKRLSEGLGERPNDRGSVLGAAREPELAPPDAHDTQARDLLGQLITEPLASRAAEPTIRTDERQITIPGTEPSAVQAQAARDQAGRGALRGEGEQRPADAGLFAPKDEPGGELFQHVTPTWEELLQRGRQVRALAQRYADAGKPAAFQGRGGLKFLVSHDLNYPPDGWRVTIFNKEGDPTGHWETKNAYEAFREVLTKQSEPIGANHPATPDTLYQRARAAIQGRIRMAPGDVRSIITLSRTADASTFMHETSHDWLKQLMSDSRHELAPPDLRADATTVRRWLQRSEDWTGFKRDGKPDVLPQERFARGFEQYLREGHAPSRALDSVFAKFKGWLTTIYRTLRGLGAPINDDIRGVFNRMLAIEPRRITHGEVPEPQGSIADIHEADAAEARPHEAEAVRNRVVSERDRYVAGQPPEVTHGLAPQAEPADQPGTAISDAGTETGRGPTAGRTLDSGSGQSEPLPRSGGGSTDRGAVEPGGGKAESESHGVGGGAAAEPPVADRRPGTGANPGIEQFAPTPAESFADTGSTEAVDLAGNVRVRNIDDSAGFIQAAMDSAERNGKYEAVRGKATMGAMIDLAQAMDLDPATITEAQLGRLFGGVEDLGPKIWALRDIIGQQGRLVHELWAKAAETQAPTDIAASTVEMARFDMMMTTLSGVTAKQGRNLGMSFRNMKDWQHAKDLNQFMKDNAGKDLYQLAMVAKLGARMDTPGKVAKLLRDSQRRSYGGMVLEYWINGLISGPSTHATYVIGNGILAIEKAGPETAAAAAIGALRARMGRQGSRVRFGEVGAQLRAAATEAPAAVQAGVEALRSGATTMLPGEEARPLMPFQGDTSLTMARGMTNAPVTWREAAGDAYGLVQGMRDGLVATGELVKAGGVPRAPMIGPVYSPLGQIPDFAYKGVKVVPLGTLARLPSRAVAAIHSTFRAMNYSMEVNALAYRQAMEEGLSGMARTARIADLRQNPSEEMMEQARGKATDLTLMGQGGRLTQNLSAFFNKTYNLPVLGETALLKFVDPFVHIAGNIMNQSLWQRTPIGLFGREIRADLSGRNGNIAQDTAMAKMLVGTSLAVTFGGLASQGLVSGSGPADPNKAAMWRLAGNQAHSVRIGDLWYDVHRLGPMGMLMSVAADMYDVVHQIGTEDADVVGKSLMHAFSQNILDESFMRGPSDLIKAVTDSGRYGAGYVRNFLSSFLPYSVGMAQMARATDPWSRQARTIMDAIRSKVPGMSESLFPRRDIWGDPMPNGAALLGPGVTAIYERQVSSDPVNQALLALGLGPAPVERRIRNVPLTDEQYDDYARIAGRTAKMQLDKIVRSPNYQAWPNTTRHEAIQETIRQARTAAEGMVMMKYPGIPRDAAAMQRARKTGETISVH